MNKFFHTALFFTVLALTVQPVMAENLLFDITTNQTHINNTVDTEKSFKESLAAATEKFKQGNVNTSYEEFKSLIEQNKGEDFYLILIAQRTAEFGMSDLTDLAFKSVSDNFLTSVYKDNLNKYYSTMNNLKTEDIIYLSEAYSNIFYNNLMLETINDLKKKTDLLTRNDYANYLMALAYYKMDNLPLAQKYITVARTQNSESTKYKYLQALILSKTTQTNSALKLVNEIKKENIQIKELNTKISAAEYLVLYNINKDAAIKDYNLAYYHYVSEEPQKALRLLTTIQTKKKKVKASVYALMSKIYFDTYDFEKASEFAQKALKLNSKESLALECMGDLKYKNAKYKNALTCYKTVYKMKNAQNVSMKLYKTYQKTEKPKKANEIMLKNLKSNNVDPEFYIEKAAITNDNNKVIYLKKALSYDIEQKDAWYALAEEMIKRNDNSAAEKFLKYAYYIDENDFRYYYYQSLIKRQEGQLDEAVKLMNKCTKLNPDFKTEKE
ncbi:hypothetical protein IJI31_06215 [bacterium]|nr:hypothetical protein [bacterium]